MMNEQEFYRNIQESIIGFLPEQYATAQITLTTKVKNNDVEQTGILVRMPEDKATPVIYLDAYFRQYEEGRGIEDILTEIAQVRDRALPSPISMLGADFLTDYENVRPLLQMRIFDTERNAKRLSGIVHHSFGDYSAAYGVLLSEDSEHAMSVMVTPELMDTWGITKKKLHDDTILADLSREPCLIPMSDMLGNMFGEGVPRNFLSDPSLTMDSLEEDGMEKLFVLTNKEKVNGAGLILNSALQEKIANAVGGNYYVLPSSLHEVLILPDMPGMEMTAAQLSEMVHTINESTVAPEDTLSDKVEYYDAGSRKLLNAAEYEREKEWGMTPPKAKAI